MAALSANSGGCKYGLWLGLGVLAARYLGGEYNRLLRDALRSIRVVTCVRTFAFLLRACMHACVRVCGCVYFCVREMLPATDGQRRRRSEAKRGEARRGEAKRSEVAAENVCDPSLPGRARERIDRMRTGHAMRRAKRSPWFLRRSPSAFCRTDVSTWSPFFSSLFLRLFLLGSVLREPRVRRTFASPSTSVSLPSESLFWNS